jgi:hypothetical protein
MAPFDGDENQIKKLSDYYLIRNTGAERRIHDGLFALTSSKGEKNGLL